MNIVIVLNDEVSRFQAETLIAHIEELMSGLINYENIYLAEH